MRLHLVRLFVALALLLSTVTPVLAECQECVYSVDGSQAFCKPAGQFDVYPGIEYSPCEVITRCFRMPGAEGFCYETCSHFGDECYLA